MTLQSHIPADFFLSMNSIKKLYNKNVPMNRIKKLYNSSFPTPWKPKWAINTFQIHTGIRRKMVCFVIYFFFRACGSTRIARLSYVVHDLHHWYGKLVANKTCRGIVSAAIRQNIFIFFQMILMAWAKGQRYVFGHCAGIFPK